MTKTLLYITCSVTLDYIYTYFILNQNTEPCLGSNSKQCFIIISWQVIIKVHWRASHKIKRVDLVPAHSHTQKICLHTSRTERLILKVTWSCVSTKWWKMAAWMKAFACTHFASSTVTFSPWLVTNTVAVWKRQNHKIEQRIIIKTNE
jgi:hypothetical protein